MIPECCVVWAANSHCLCGDRTGVVPKTCSQQADNRRGPASYSGGAQSSRDFGRTEKCLLRRTLSTLSLGRHYFCSEPGFWQCHVYTTGLICGKVKSICWQYLFATFITNTVLSLTCAHLNKDSLIILEVFVITFLLYNYECVDRYADHFSFLTYWHQYDENVELVLSQLGGRVLWMFWQNYSILCLGNDFRVPFMLLWLTSKDRLLNSRGLASRVCTSPNQLISKPVRLCSL